MEGTGPPGPGRCVSGDADGNGARGPERTCPGLGAPPGSGFAAGAVGRPGAITAAGGICL